MAALPANIRKLFDEFYAGFKGKGGLNIVFYPASGVDGAFEIACGVQLESGGNAVTPEGLVATTVYFGAYDRMAPAHEAIHRWVRETGHKLAGPSLGGLRSLERRSRQAPNRHLLPSRRVTNAKPAAVFPSVLRLSQKDFRPRSARKWQAPCHPWAGCKKTTARDGECCGSPRS